MAARLSLLCALALTLTSCASLRQPKVVFVPPKVECGVFESPKVSAPKLPGPSERDVAVWQMWGLGWQALAEHVFAQRVETAQCVAKLREVGIVK